VVEEVEVKVDLQLSLLLVDQAEVVAKEAIKGVEQVVILPL
tara:strand:+ start:223 stop:345 length:123 start_codon:yes stop_codon:yes gene_type:complete